MSLRERRLIRKLRDRDEKAFREIVDLHRDRVFNLTYRMMGNREEAEDVAQEVFITVFKSIDKFRGDSKFSTWLYRVTANHCKNRIKYLSRRHDRDKDEYDEGRERGSAAGSLTSRSSPSHHGLPLACWPPSWGISPRIHIRATSPSSASQKKGASHVPRAISHPASGMPTTKAPDQPISTTAMARARWS